MAPSEPPQTLLDYCLLRLGSGDLHRFREQIIIDVDVGAHRSSPR
jgi:hypothetical protein